jgi:transcriptional regulator
VTFRKQLLDVLSHEPRSASWLARELGMSRTALEDDLRHMLRSARAAGHDIEIVPARCKSCDFVFGEDRLIKPSRCPVCKGTRLFEPLIGIRRAG